MYIFIDESGNFINPDKRDNFISCVGAVIILEEKLNKIYDEFIILKRNWGCFTEELKGHQLDEAQVSSVVEMLYKNRARLFITAIDMGIQDDAETQKWKESQANKFTENLTPQHSQNAFEYSHELKERFFNLPNQLMIQCVLQIHLIDQVLKRTTVYYCQRQAHTLKSFIWIIDAKDKTITEYEDLWKTIIGPILQSHSFDEPLDSLIGGNYKYFERFRQKVDDQLDYIKKLYKPGLQIEDAVNIKAILKDLTFKNSKDDLGLQLADIMISSVRRALNNQLGIKGWGNIGRLMIYKKGKTIELFQLRETKDEISIDAPYKNVIIEFEKKAQNILC